MGRINIVEVLDRRGRVRERVRIDTLPATVGRGYTNDVILDDRYVSAEHCRVDEDETGSIFIEDLGSVNGLFVDGASDGKRRLGVTSGMRVRVGETVLRFVEATHPVEEALPLRSQDGALRALGGPRVAVASVLAAVVVLAVDTYLGTYYDLRFTTVATEVLAGLGALSLWAGTWALANRLLTHRFDYRRHLAWTSLVFLLAWGVGSFVDYTWFLFSAERFAATLDFTAHGALFGVLLWGHLAIVPAATPRRRASWALRSAFFFVVTAVFVTHSDMNDFSTDVPITVPLKPFGAEWAPAVSMEEFLADVRSTKDWVDTRARAHRK